MADPDLFLSQFKQRLSDCASQDWHSNINNVDKLSTYCMFKSLLDIERYLLNIPNTKHRQALTRLRISAHSLMIEKGRYQGLPREERHCTYCLTSGEKYIEDEFHLILICKLYSDLRNCLIKDLIRTNSHESFIYIMQQNNTDSLKRISKYVYECYALRELFLIRTIRWEAPFYQTD